VPWDRRLAAQDDVLPSGWKVQAGQYVSLVISAIGRDSHLFERPDEFHPERWLIEGKATRRPDEYVFPVFWGGPRLCLGKDMARLEMLNIAYAILSEYDFHVSPHSEKMVNGPVQFYEGGLPCKVTKRRRAA
jgi:cytochrome P450